MKKRVIKLIFILSVCSLMLFGCGVESETVAKTEGNVEETVTEEAVEDNSNADNAEADNTETDNAETDNVEADNTKTEEASSDEQAAEENAEDVAAIDLEDGVYSAEFNTDSTMFHANESCDGKGTLTVENGKAVFHVSLVSKNVVNLYLGTVEQAAEDEANWLMPTTDEVTYSDGTSEEVYGFDIPINSVNQEFDLALFGAKGKWYDHKVSVDNPEKQ